MNNEIIKETFDLRKKVYKRVLTQTEGQPRVIQMAKCLSAFLMEKAVCVSSDDILAGNAQYCNCAYSAPADFHEEITKYTDKTGVVDPRLYVFEAGLRAKLYQRGQAGHVIAGYGQVLESGVGALIEKAKQCADTSTCGDTRDLAVASDIVCTALSAYIERYAGEARCIGMMQTADRCQNIARKPPKNFHEAVQLLWFLHEVVIFEQYCGSMSLGRLDLLLLRFYEEDTAKGVIDRNKASEIIEAFFKKLGGLRRGYQNVTLGGGKDGGFVDNDITRICLNASKNLMIDQPLLSMRYTPDMSDELWDEVLDLMRTGIGFPAMFNDAVAIQSKVRASISQVDAQNYGIVGCVEVSVPGKEYAHTEGLRINWAKVLELMFNRGKCSFTGHSLVLRENRELKSIKSFEEFYIWYKAELHNFLTLAMDATNTLDTSYAENWPTPYMSTLMQGCIEKGKDINAGGAVYNLTTVNGCGMANVVDSLCAVRKVVFEDRLCTLPQLAEILANNFEGMEGLRKFLLKRCPKFGNDDDKADLIMADLTEMFCKTVSNYKNPRGGSFQSGLYTVDHHAHMGERTAALPDGRKAGESLANGFSPYQGADTSGPTAVINSVVKNDLCALGNGMVLDLKFYPGFFEENRRYIRALIETYFDLGGYEIQLNVVDKDKLLAAQKNPEQYRDLIVRVSGFSAYFVDLGAILQEEIIARTEHGY